MLTQYGVQAQLDMIANEVSNMPGLYYELYSRLFSERVHRWMQTVSPAHAELIHKVASEDPDYIADLELHESDIQDSGMQDCGIRVPVYVLPTQQFNPAWDMDY